MLCVFHLQRYHMGYHGNKREVGFRCAPNFIVTVPISACDTTELQLAKDGGPGVLYALANGI